MKIVPAFLLSSFLFVAAPCGGADAGEAAGPQDRVTVVSVRLRRIGAEPVPIKIVEGVTTRAQLLAVRKPRSRLILANGIESWKYPVEPTMRGPTIIPPDAELTLLFDAAGVVRKLQLHEPPLPRLALRNTPRPMAVTPP